MSAWVVAREHIDVLIRYGLSEPSDRLYWQKDPEQGWNSENVRELTRETATDIGRTLWQENVASVCYRYEDDTADDYPEAFEYEYRDPGYTLTPNEALQAVRCLDYQSCEHDGWMSSEARRCLDAIQARAISKLADGPWGWDANELEKRPKTRSIFAV